MEKIRNHWQFLAILVPIIFILANQLVNYGGIKAKVAETEIKLEKYIDSNTIVNTKFASQLEKLTIAVTRSNTIMEIYLMKKGFIKNREDIIDYE
ncbi:MAG TPA: hypothetical protein VMX17_15985 [Candidatus Glassbacteria bacterium]|nr:hypothetical protein [Candidatus Glassbacteria bacterium]